MLRRSLSASIVFAVMVVAGLTNPAWGGKPVPFKGTVEGVHVSRTPIDPPVVFDVFELVGKGTHLGKLDLVIEAVVDFGTLPPTATGTFNFTAPNGDRVAADFTGSSQLVVPGLVLITEHAVINPNQSTGRFAGATGKFTLRRLADAATGVTGVTSGSFDGTITLAKTRCLAK